MSANKVFHHSRRVEFCETDAAGIAHFGALIVYLEQAEHAFLRAVGTTVFSKTVDFDGRQLPSISWPRVRVECDFTGAAHFEDLLDLAVSVDRIGEKSITYHFDVTCQSRPICTGKVTAVCCQVIPGQPLLGIRIPDDFRERVAPYARSPG